MNLRDRELEATVTWGRPVKVIHVDMTPRPCTWCGAEAAVGPCPLSLTCRTCQAAPGIKCRRPSGHDCDMHARRIRDAERDLPPEMQLP